MTTVLNHYNSLLTITGKSNLENNLIQQNINIVSSTEYTFYIYIFYIYSFAQSGSKAHNEMRAYIYAEENLNEAKRNIFVNLIFTELCIIL